MLGQTTTPLAFRWTAPFRALTEAVGHAIEIRNRRRTFARLAELEPRILEDIGVTPEDIAWGLELPLERNAALEVRRRRALSRR